MILSNKIKIGSLITSFFFLQNIAIMADQPIDCENEDYKSAIPSYALTEEEKVQLLEMELINALNTFDECIENKNKLLVASSKGSSSSASRSSYGENSTASVEEKGSSSSSGNSQTVQSNNLPSQSAQTQPSAGGSISEGDMESSDDDDIVARQLREAATAEEDPVIKELLWERYRDYKGINKD